jgi:hypothetical protein
VSILYSVSESSCDLGSETFKLNLKNYIYILSRNMALEITGPLTEMSPRCLRGGKSWPTRNADNLIAMLELIVSKIWDPLRLTTL